MTDLRTFSAFGGFTGGGLNPTQDVIPVRKENDWADSPLTVVYDVEGTPTDVIASVPITVPSGTLALGGDLNSDGSLQRGVTELKDAGNSILSVNNVTGSLGIAPLAQVKTDPNSPFGVGRVRSPQGTPFQFGNFGGTDTSTLTFDGDRRVIFDVITQTNSYITAFIFKGLTGKVHFDVIDTTCADGVDSLVYTSSQGFPIDFGAADINDNILYETANPFFLSKDNLLRVEFYSADGERVEIRGQTLDPIPPTGDIMSFIPFFEIQASTVTERIIFHNDRVTDVNSDLNILGSFVHAVDTTTAPVTLTANPDVTRFFDVIDAEANFGANSCMVDLQVDNTRAFPNDLISSFDAKSFTATLVDVGASGVRNVLSEGGSPKFYHDGTDWVVQTDSDMLTFKDVDNRSGFVWFRIIGVDAALTVGNQTQLIKNFSGKKVVVDKIGSTSDTVDSITGLKIVDESGSLVFDDKVTETMYTLDETSKSYTFWYDGTTWSKFEKGIPEAPKDGKLYSRKDATWVQDNAADTFYDPSTSVDLTAMNVQDAINELDAYQRGVMCFELNAVDTIIPAINTPVKVVGTFIASPNNRGFSLVNNSLVYDLNKPKVFDIEVLLSFTKHAGSGGVDTYIFYIYLNGAPIGCGSTASAAETNDTMSCGIMVDRVLNEDDVLELWVENITGAANVDVNNCSILVR